MSRPRRTARITACITARTLALVLALVVVPALAACGGRDDGTTAAAAATSTAGVYPLRTYDGAALPLLLEEDATEGKLELMSGHVTLRADGTFNEAMTYRLTPATAGATAIVDSLGSSGRYTTTGTQITFAFPDGGVVSARLADNTITIVGQVTFVYQR